MSPLYDRRAHLLDDGDLLVIFDEIGIARLDLQRIVPERVAGWLPRATD